MTLSYFNHFSYSHFRSPNILYNNTVYSSVNIPETSQRLPLGNPPVKQKSRTLL